MADDDILDSLSGDVPQWATALIVQVARLNERLDPHIEKVNDHEKRIRALETSTSTNAWVPKIAWTVSAALVVALVGWVVALATGQI